MGSPRPPDFSAFIAEIARQLQARGIPFMLIGGQAVLLHGRPRLTEDIDITLGADPSRLSEVLDVCSSGLRRALSGSVIVCPAPLACW